ncbi:hypothetical protein [Desulfosporosinus hippei]|uniref:DUF4367 domain-containing protein n=1 Tax=Desulfosporosinus hippei DSM 8344 TaxID=1121419 RepID=A0A1G7S8G8_9FIRM|nr:hypothetical protein [Desulfosporosinus hippei]SDG18470.1 hypothetical protein SAMN05443529_101301 [Desulfosporosinus hippei DSM 8344]
MKGLDNMKRKIFTFASLALVAGLITFVNPVKTLALDALSIFRVNDVKTIEITMADLQEGMQTISNLKEDFKGKEFEHKSLLNLISEPKHEVTKLNSAGEFDAFKLRLPSELASQTPEISALDSREMKFTLDVDASNELLKLLHSPKQLSSSLNGVEMSMVSSAAAFAKYEDVLFLATQKSYLDAPQAAKEELRDVMLNLPLIPTNLRQQLAEIDEGSSDIYLPVLVGFGREVDLGGKKGYIYTLSDLKGLTETIPQDMTVTGSHSTSLEGLNGRSHEALMDEMSKTMISKYGEEKFAALKEAHTMAMEEMSNMDNASVLIWTKDGNLYGLIGNKTDAELAEIARSVR